MYHEDVERIRKRAHQIWEREGRPEGRELAHWDMAREELAQQDNADLTLEQNPVTSEVDWTDRPEPVEPLEAVVNQGDFPGMTDQGEEQQYPYKPTTENV